MINHFSYLPKFLTANHYTIADKEVQLQVASHPDFPSLYAITDTLTKLGIDNGAFKVEKEQFNQLPTNFIAVLDNTSANNAIVMVEKKAKMVNVHYEDGKKEKLSVNDFLQRWTGIVVAIEPNEKQKLKVKFNTSLILVIALGLIGLLSVTLTYNWLLMLTFLILALGIGISLLIVQERLGIHNQIVAKVCNAGSTTNCDAVISSKGSKLFGVIELSDASIVYFSSLWVSSIILSVSGWSLVAFYATMITSVIILPYTIYYQWRVVKKWCVLCIGIAIVLMILSLLGVLYITQSTLSYSWNSNYKSIGLLFGSALFVTFIWLVLKKLWTENTTLKNMEVKYHTFKKNPEVFNATLQQSTQLTKPNYTPLVIGNKGAKAQLTLALSPSCGHCYRAFKELQQLLQTYPTISANILFNINVKNTQNPHNKIAKRLMEIYIEEENISDALSDWFNKTMDLDTWLKAWGEAKTDEIDNLIVQHFNWCTDNNINYTPAIMYSNHVLPKIYNLKDLKYFLDIDEPI